MLAHLKRTGAKLRKSISATSRISGKTFSSDEAEQLLLEANLGSQGEEDSSEDSVAHREKYLDDGTKPLTQGEVAFLDKSTRQYVQRCAEDREPRVNERQGVVLYVDISGFARMGIILRDKLSPVSAVEDFSRRAVLIINAWTDICVRYGGDVVKYAGDALLCTWLLPTKDDLQAAQDARSEARRLAESEGREFDLYDQEDDDINTNIEQLRRLANRAALEMLLHSQNQNTAGSVNIHGGIGVGAVQDIFLCDDTGGLRWHLVSGQAVDDATALLEFAPRGEIIVAEDSAYSDHKRTWSITDRSDPVHDSAHFARGPDDHVYLHRQSFMPVVFGGISTLSPPARGRSKTLPHLPKEVSSTFAQHRAAAASEAANAAVRRGPGLDPQTVRSFIPLALRGRINRYAFQGGELRWCAIMFVSIPNVKIGPDKDAHGHLSGLEDFNDTFLQVAKLIHRSNGEVRDLLFDDKGCIFIAVFGAYRRLENSELWLMRAAKNITRVMPECSIGAASGMCYAGLCGTSRRYDFIVMGYTVNLASRLMGGALKHGHGIVVDQSIRDQTARYYKFDQFTVEKEKATYTEKYMGYYLRGRMIQTRRETRLGIQSNSIQVCRSVEEDLISNFIAAVDSKPASMAIVTIEGAPGMGKTSMANWIRRALPFKVLYTHALPGTMDDAYMPFRQLVERFLGLSRNMHFKRDIVPRLEQIEAEYGITGDRLAVLLPYIAENLENCGDSEAGDAPQDNDDNSEAGGFWVSLRRTSSVQSFLSLRSHNNYNNGSSYNLNAAEQEESVFELLLDVFHAARGDEKTLLIVLDDAVWLDPSSQHLLLQMCHRKDELAGIVLAMTFRTDHDSDTAAMEWNECINQMRKAVGRQTRIVLEPFSRVSTKQLIITTLEQRGSYALHSGGRRSVALGPGAMPPKQLTITEPVLDLVYRKTEGNPGAIYDKTRMLIDKRYVKVTKSGDVVFASDSRRMLAEQDSPKSVLEIYLDRFDKLDEEEQALLKVAACISVGGEFDSKLVRRVFQLEARIDPRRELSKSQIEATMQRLAVKGFLQHKEEAKSRKSRKRMWEFVSGSVVQAVLHVVPYDRQLEIKQELEMQSHPDLSLELADFRETINSGNGY